MTQNVTQTGRQTTDATPVKLYSQSISENSTMQVECFYNVKKNGDVSQTHWEKLKSSFYRVTGGSISVVGASQDEQELGDIQSSITSSLPWIQFVTNTVNNKAEIWLNGTSDTLDWDFIISTNTNS